MYRNTNKSKLIGNLSTEHTLDSFHFYKTKNNSSIHTLNTERNNKINDISKGNNVFQLPPISDKDREKSNPKLLLKLNLLKSCNQTDVIRKKVIKGRLMKLVRNSIFDVYNEEEVSVNENRKIKGSNRRNM